MIDPETGHLVATVFITRRRPAGDEKQGELFVKLTTRRNISVLAEIDWPVWEGGMLTASRWSAETSGFVSLTLAFRTVKAHSSSWVSPS